MAWLRKKRSTGKDFPLRIEVLQYSPLPYQAPGAWTAFLDAFESRARKTLEQTNPDDLNGDMFDPMIEAAAREACASALRQKTEHLHTIRYHQKVLQSNLTEARALRLDLEDALDEVCRQLAECGVRAAVQNNEEEIA